MTAPTTAVDGRTLARYLRAAAAEVERRPLSAPVRIEDAVEYAMPGMRDRCDAYYLAALDAVARAAQLKVRTDALAAVQAWQRTVARQRAEDVLTLAARQVTA